MTSTGQRGGDQPRIFGRSSPFCGRQSRSRNLFLHRRLRTTLVKRSMRAKAHSCFGAWNAPGFYIECSSCSSSRRSAGWAVRQTVRTKSTEKRQLGANNLCYVPPHRFPLYPRPPVSLPLIFFSLSPQQRYVLCPGFVRLFSVRGEGSLAPRRGLSLLRSRDAGLIDEERTEFETEASRLWSFRVNHRWKSPSYQVNELPTSPCPTGSRAPWG